MHTIVGTPYYVAPEVLRGNYDFSCDIWSLGVILFIMLCGYPPFNGDTVEDIFNNILSGNIRWPPPEFDDASAEAKSLIKSLLKLDPTRLICYEGGGGVAEGNGQSEQRTRKP